MSSNSNKTYIRLYIIAIFSVIIFAILISEIAFSTNTRPSNFIQKLISKESNSVQHLSNIDLPEVRYETKSSSLLPQNIENTQTIKELLKPPIESYTNPDFPKFSFEYPVSWKWGESRGLNSTILVYKDNTDVNIKLISKLTYDGFGYSCSEKADYKEISGGFAGWTRVYKDQEWVYVKNYNVYTNHTFKKQPGIDYSANNTSFEFNKKRLDQGNFAAGSPFDFEPDHTYKICLNNAYNMISMKKSNLKIEGKDLATYGTFTVKQLGLDEALLAEADQIIINLKGVKDPLKLPCQNEECGNDN